MKKTTDKMYLIFPDRGLNEIMGCVKGKKMLDIGCGFMSDLCRKLHEQGAEIIGLDINPEIRQEKFKTIVADVFSIAPYFGDIFQKNHFDAVITKGFWSDPNVEHALEKDGLSTNSINLISGINEILKPNGIYYNMDWGIANPFFDRILDKKSMKTLGYSVLFNIPPESRCSYEVNIFKKNRR